MDWTRGRTIGRGSTATVSTATAHGSGRVLAVKSAELSQSEFLKREQRILSTLSCPQIVAYRGCDITCENGKLLYNIFMEYAPRGTLVDAIRSRGGGLEEAEIKAYTRNIVLGLEYLHSNGIVHCDIKCHNVLVTGDGVKIADLGCARRIDDDGVTSDDLAIAGTPVFMAPEVARGEQQGFPADVWAMGCAVIEMATGRAPWTDASGPVSALYRIGYSGDVPEAPSFMSKQAKDFLDKCLKRDPVDRWSARELLNHAFLEEAKEPNCFDSDTPTTVLDQGIWDSIEEPETIPSPTHKSSSDSPGERIRRLGRISTTSSQGMPNWVLDEGWITVRSNGSKEPEMFNCSQEKELVYSNEPTSSGAGACNPSSSCNCSYVSSNRSVSLMAYECKKEAFKCKKDELCGNIDLRIKWTVFLHSQLFFSFFHYHMIHESDPMQ
ncbi:mitogen-activated protein kinase kinase kinase 18-like [Corylus avellana]|uniref:mitogen-activated protein kinase kinase kinase 18-like n=1 Tax=Corylus avellana TaxID=13451 RepID=UPI00286C2602|nr:mitogen-activated protein kinase kinase kinase 18-like [Corylus avellana]